MRFSQWLGVKHGEEVHGTAFFEHRMRNEEMEEQFNKKVKLGWMFAARITDANARSGDCKHTSGWSLCGMCGS